MKNRNRRAVLIAAALLCAALTAGCSLARSDDFAGQDELVGVLARLQPDGWEDGDDFFEYDEEAVMDYVKAHASARSDGAMTLPEGLGGGMHIVTDSERDQCMLWEDRTDEAGQRAVGLEAGPVFSECHQQINVTDEGESVEISATLYLEAELARGEDALLTIYPVYRRPDGILYAAPTGGMMGYLDGYSQTLSTEAAQTDAEGKTTRQSRSFRVSAAAKPRVNGVTLVEMDADNNPVASREIDLTRETLAETVSPGTAWVLLETRTAGASWDDHAQETLAREAIDLQDGRGEATLYLPTGQPGILAPRTLTVAYPGAVPEGDI